MILLVLISAYILIVLLSWKVGNRHMLISMRSCCGLYKENGTVSNCCLGNCPMLNRA